MTQKYKDTIPGIKEANQVPSNDGTDTPSFKSSWISPIVQQLVAGVTGFFFLTLLVLLFSELVEAKNIEGYWHCEFSADNDRSTILYGLWLDEAFLDSVTGSYQNLTTPDLTDFGMPGFLRGSVVKRFFLFPTELKIYTDDLESDSYLIRLAITNEVLMEGRYTGLDESLNPGDVKCTREASFSDLQIDQG